MHPLIAALALHHPHHHATNGAVQAFHQFGIVTHHGSGEALFWVVVAVLALIAIMWRLNSRSRA